MKAKLPQPIHESYLKHRKQRAWQVILPVVFAGILFIALIVLINIATFRDNGDVARWSAISTIWIVVPIMVAMLIFLILLSGIIYLLARLLNITPMYTGQAQAFVYKIAGYIKRAADAAVKPILQFEGFMASVNAFFERIKP